MAKEFEYNCGIVLSREQLVFIRFCRQYLRVFDGLFFKYFRIAGDVLQLPTVLHLLAM